MTNHTFELHATPRTDLGKGASRRLRRTDQIPAIIYGTDVAPQTVCFPQKDVRKATENEAFFSHILTVHLSGKQQKVIIKDMQRHPYKPIIMHMDLLRINMNEEMTMHVPLHFVGGENSPGVKDGGMVAHLITNVDIACLPADLPEYISVDISNLGLNDMIHLSDLKLPKGVRLTELEGDEPNDLSVVHITVLKVKEESTEEEAEGESGESAADENSEEK